MRPELSLTKLIVTVALAAVILALTVNAIVRGPWLDEFWTLELSDHRKGVDVLIGDGWLRDTHPPVFNLWATFLSLIGVTSIPVARLASNLPAAALLIFAAVRFSRRMPEQAGFYAAMLLLTLSLPQAVDAFGNYRSYFWQIASFATLAFVARHVVFTDADLDIRKDFDLTIIAVLATTGSVALHYIGGLFGGLLVGAVALCASARGHRRWARLVLVTAAISTLLVVAIAMLQAPHWAVDLDHSWIEGDSLAALGVTLGLVVGAICHNPLPFAGLWMGWRRWAKQESVFLAAMIGILVFGVAIILAINWFRPIVVARYISPVPVLVCAGLAALATKFAQDWRLLGLLAVSTVAVVAGPMILNGAKPLWEESAGTIARIVADCPATQVYAASGWAIGPAAATRTARREDPVFQRAYEMLARKYAFRVQFIGQKGGAYVELGRCPVLVWYEHTPNHAEDDPQIALAAAGFKGLEAAQLSTIRSASGFVVRADAP